MSIRPSAYCLPLMARLSRADLEAAPAFAAEVGTAAREAERADGWILERMARLVPAEVATYGQLETSSSRILALADYPVGPPVDEPVMPSGHDLEVWLTQNPFCTYADVTANPYFFAVRLSDIVDYEVFARTEFAAMSDPNISKVIQMRIPGSTGTHWSLAVGRGGRDYLERDCLMLDAVRPSLVAYEAHRALAATIAGLLAVRDSVPSDGLSPRENEILDLVAGGATNADIATSLWIAPATVKKHLENIYAKLEVGSRTAALAYSGRSITSRH